MISIVTTSILFQGTLASIFNLSEGPSHGIKFTSLPHSDGESQIPIIALEFDGVVSRAYLSLYPYASSSAVIDPNNFPNLYRFAATDAENRSIALNEYEWEEDYLADFEYTVGNLRASVDSNFMNAVGSVVLRIRDGQYQDLHIPPAGSRVSGMMYHSLSADSLATGHWEFYHKSVSIRLDTLVPHSERAYEIAHRWLSAGSFASPFNRRVSNVVLNPSIFGNVDIHLDNTNRRVGFLFIV